MNIKGDGVTGPIDLPEPPVPLDADLRGLEWMPYYGDRLARSEFNARCSDSVYRAAHNLWWSSWNNVPAASLPNDDVALTRFADFGRDVKTFNRIKADAMHGFVLCADGRWYHFALAKMASEAWSRRVKERDRKAKWRQGKDGDETGTRRGQDGDRTRQTTGHEVGHEVGQNVSGTDDRRGEERTGQDRKESPSSPQPKNLVEIGNSVLEAFGIDQARYLGNFGGIAAKLATGVKPDEVLGVATRLAERMAGKPPLRDPIAWMFAIRDGRCAFDDELARLRDDGPQFASQAEEQRELHRCHLRAWKAKRSWAETWGPRPDQFGCEVPADVLTEFGIEPWEAAAE